jgi:predicted type IV restriction endonuclease
MHLCLRMEALNFPLYHFKIKQEGGREQIFDALRRKFLVLTPEEWVRQHVIRYLIEEKGYPPLLIAIEKSITINGLKRRCDIICYNSKKEVLLVVECKAPEVKITQETFDQVVKYHLSIGARCIVVTNGKKHYVCLASDLSYSFLSLIPNFTELNG